MYTQVKDTDEGLIFTFAYETQELLQGISTDTSQYYLNTILSVSINMNKFNIDTTSYMFTHNMRECISTAIETERNKLYNLKNSKVTDFLGALINITIASGNYKIINTVLEFRQDLVNETYQKGLNGLADFYYGHIKNTVNPVVGNLIKSSGIEAGLFMFVIGASIVLLLPVGL